MIGKLKVKLHDVSTNLEGKSIISFEVMDSKYTLGTLIDKLKELIAKQKDLFVVEVKQHRNKRSLNANSYAWTLLTKIADVLRTSKEDEYLKSLKNYGQSQVVSVIKEGAEILKRSVKYCEEFGESTLNGKEFVHVKVYTGSSEFNTKEMAIFIDGIISDCKELDIETMTPNELEKLKNSWK